MSEDNLFDMEDRGSISKNSSDEYDVVPQKVEKFKLIEDPDKIKFISKVITQPD